MKFTKKNVLAIGAAVMMTASLATFASASTPGFTSVPIHADPGTVVAVDVDLSCMERIGTPEDASIPVSADSVPCVLASEVHSEEMEVATGTVRVVAGEVDESTLADGGVLVLHVIDSGALDE